MKLYKLAGPAEALPHSRHDFADELLSQWRTPKPVMVTGQLATAFRVALFGRVTVA